MTYKAIFSLHALFAILLFASFQSTIAQTATPTPITITINPNNRAQTIQNFGASGCWYSEGIGKYWPAEKKEKIAELLFSRKTGKGGQPRGIGLSAWRFNIGGGTAEQGLAGGIKDPNHRVESFLAPNGTWDWNKQSGYQWFLKKAKEYGVENLIAFSNTPPVQFTINGFGFKTEKDSIANLKPDKYAAYAMFLSEVMAHFDKIGLHFNYLSPVNEPQWDWTGKVGEAKQEGTPWTNAEIFKVVSSLDSALLSKKLTTKILTAEAAMLSFLYGNHTNNSRQIQQFYAPESNLSFAKFATVPRVIAGHSYFTESSDSNLINTRRNVADTAAKYGVDFWQSEYSMLDNGYKEGSTGSRSQMDCALFLAKVIHHDLTVANAGAWQFWNAYEPGRADFDTRYYLIALKPDSGFLNGDFTPTKNLWGLGHFSLLIRPGMQRLKIARSDNASDFVAAQKTMISAYLGEKGKLVIVAINYQQTEQKISLNLENSVKVKKVMTYTTTAAVDKNMKPAELKSVKDAVTLPARSITTIVVN